MNGGIQGLRAVFIFMIFLSHFPFGGARFDVLGDCGTAMFMMLSGYTLSLAYASRPVGRSRAARLDFMKRRLRRIMPVHLLCLLLCSVGGGSMLAAAANALLLQSWVPRADFFFSFNGPSWFVSSLVFCYALFPALSRLLASRPRVFAGLLCALTAVFIPASALLPEHLDLALVYVWPPSRLLDFMLGMGLHTLTARRARPMPAAARIAAVVVLVAACSLWSVAPQWCRLASLWYLPSALLIAAFAAGGGVSLPSPLGWLAGYSFGFYMIHAFCISSWSAIFSRLGADIVSPAGFALTLATSLALGVLVEKWARAVSPSKNYA